MYSIYMQIKAQDYICMEYPRALERQVTALLQQQARIAIIGPRQVGKPSWRGKLPTVAGLKLV